MARRVGRAAILALAAASAVSCILGIDPLPTSAEAGDAGEDAAGDARPVIDAAPAADGAGVTVEAGASYCARVTPAPVLCEDFDDGGFADAWQPVVDDAGVVGVEDAALRLALAPRSAADPCAYAILDRPLAIAVPTRMRVAYDLRVGHLEDDGGYPIGFASMSTRLAASGGTNECPFYLKLDPASPLQLAVDPPAASALRLPATATIPPGKWTHVEMLVDRNAGAPVASVTLDGVTALDRAPVSPCQDEVVSRLRVGLLCVNNPGGDLELRVDNVALWVE